MAHNESNGFNYDRVYYGGTYYESVAGRAVMTKEQDGELTYESTHNFNFKNYTVEVYADIPTPVLIYLDFTVDNGVLSIDYVADFTTTVGNIVFAIEPVSARGEFTDALILESDSSVGTVSEELPESFKDGKYVATVFVSSIGFLKEGAVTTTYNAEDNEAWVAKQVAGKTQTLYFDEYTFLPTNFTFSYDAPAVITSESSQIVLIVDQGILSDGAVLLRDIVETKRFEDGILAEHKLVYAGSEFSYDAIDPLIQVVTRDDEFTSEFFSEITALNVVASDFSYSDLVKLVGVSAVDEVLLHIAGSDGYFVA
ncbi:hypothetical protein GH816_01330 [Betaproteobacteria bacterium LSUCC0115]|nr:hypothetical protein [Burkholderiales bacterium LSUCC0115]